MGGLCCSKKLNIETQCITIWEKRFNLRSNNQNKKTWIGKNNKSVRSSIQRVYLTWEKLRGLATRISLWIN